MPTPAKPCLQQAGTHRRHIVETVFHTRVAQPVPLLNNINTGGIPKRLTADSGYYNQDQIQQLTKDIGAYIATRKHMHTDPILKPPHGRIPNNAMTNCGMARKIRTIKRRCIYAEKKHIVEPVFGEIKELQGFDHFTFRSVKKVTSECNLICITHYFLKLYRPD